MTNIAETIYQHVKAMPHTKAVEVLHFVEFLETKLYTLAQTVSENEMFEFMQNLPVGKRTGQEINKDFHALRDEWNS